MHTECSSDAKQMSDMQEKTLFETITSNISLNYLFRITFVVFCLDWLMKLSFVSSEEKPLVVELVFEIKMVLSCEPLVQLIIM